MDAINISYHDLGFNTAVREAIAIVGKKKAEGQINAQQSAEICMAILELIPSKFPRKLGNTWQAVGKVADGIVQEIAADYTPNPAPPEGTACGQTAGNAPKGECTEARCHTSHSTGADGSQGPSAVEGA